MDEDRAQVDKAQRAAELIHNPLTQGWSDDMAANRCTASKQMGDVTVRCDAQQGHAGPDHQSHRDGRLVHWHE
jgi:hypothetical protein